MGARCQGGSLTPRGPAPFGHRRSRRVGVAVGVGATDVLEGQAGAVPACIEVDGSPILCRCNHTREKFGASAVSFMESTVYAEGGANGSQGEQLDSFVFILST